MEQPKKKNEERATRDCSSSSFWWHGQNSTYVATTVKRKLEPENMLKNTKPNRSRTGKQNE
jgi:hypothetical protein